MSHPAAAECQDQRCRRPSLAHSRLYLLGASRHGRSDRTSSNPRERAEHPRELGLRMGCTDSTYSPPGPAAGQACLATCLGRLPGYLALRPQPGHRDDKAQANHGREECDPTPAAAMCTPSTLVLTTQSGTRILPPKRLWPLLTQPSRVERR